jgi:Protein of unknown function (DUF3225)
MDPMDIDIPEVVAEVTAAFRRYEAALVTNDIGVLDAAFWDDSPPSAATSPPPTPSSSARTRAEKGGRARPGCGPTRAGRW